jgi:diaminopimelate decarboxylase
MDHFHHNAAGVLHGESVAIPDLIADVGSPAYIYSAATLTDHCDKLAAAFADLDPLICYSIKSRGNIHLLRLLQLTTA